MKICDDRHSEIVYEEGEDSDGECPICSRINLLEDDIEKLEDDIEELEEENKVLSKENLRLRSKIDRLEK